MTKPTWDQAPYWAKYLAMDDDYEWHWWSAWPEYNRMTGKWECEWAQRLVATVPYDESETLEGRPEE